jgi:hypothetical protein
MIWYNSEVSLKDANGILVGIFQPNNSPNISIILHVDEEGIVLYKHDIRSLAYEEPEPHEVLARYEKKINKIKASLSYRSLAAVRNTHP